MAAGEISPVAAPYSGLAVLVFAGGQRYPVIIGKAPVILQIEDVSRPPLFPGNKANEYLYAQLSGKEQGAAASPDDFALLMIRAKQLLEASYSIRTVAELSATKEEVHAFVRDQYDSLRYSDMVRRVVAQYFMMHEYVAYHVEGTPAQDIKGQYQREVLAGVNSWLAILRPHIPAHEILNYIVSLYYQRSMVTFAALIVDKYRDIAFCPGVEKETWDFPPDRLIAGVSGSEKKQLGTIRGEKIFAFVSEACPVSMVETVVTARRLADRKEDTRLIVLPLEQLSETHLAMNRMVSNGNMLFMDDEQWRKEHLTERITLPLFIKNNL